jgi:integrase
MSNEITVANSNWVNVVDMALTTLESERSQRVYLQTFDAWATWCDENGNDIFNFLLVSDWIASQDTTKATRQRQLSAMRKLAQTLYILTGDDVAQRMLAVLKMIKAPKPDQEITDSQERKRKALSPSEAERLLHVWDGDNTPRGKRNCAMIAVMLLSGVRRAELAAIMWPDVNLEEGTIFIRHGKGDKSRDVALAGDFAIRALRELMEVMPYDCRYVFRSVRKGGKFNIEDKPITGTDVYRMWRKSCVMAGVDSTKPHDARRTFITEGLTVGVETHNIQKQVGHARADTTLHYAQSLDAKNIRAKLRFRYGG